MHSHSPSPPDGPGTTESRFRPAMRRTSSRTARASSSTSTRPSCTAWARSSRVVYWLAASYWRSAFAHLVRHFRPLRGSASLRTGRPRRPRRSRTCASRRGIRTRRSSTRPGPVLRLRLRCGRRRAADTGPPWPVEVRRGSPGAPLPGQGCSRGRPRCAPGPPRALPASGSRLAQPPREHAPPEHAPREHDPGERRGPGPGRAGRGGRPCGPPRCACSRPARPGAPRAGTCARAR